MRNGTTSKRPRKPQRAELSTQAAAADHNQGEPDHREASSLASLLAREEFHRPLAVIGNCCRTILEMRCVRLDEPCKELLLKIYDEAGRMNQRISGLLSSSRDPRNRWEAVDLGELARGIIEGFMLTKPERRVKFVVDRDAVAEGDPGLLRIALKNLLDNAWKYTAHKEETLIEFGTVELPGESAFFVRDNGIGFEPTKMGQLFDPPDANRDCDATGIGLDTARKVIQRHKGRIWADGKVGTGATIYFTLG